MSDVTIHLASYSIGDTADDLRPIPRRANSYPERALAKRKIDDSDDLTIRERELSESTLRELP